jgi:phasin
MVVSKEWVAEHFEIPIEARQLAEKSVDEAKKAFDNFVVASQKVTTSFEAQVAAAQAGSKEVHSKVRTFAERNIATCFEFAQKFVHAKNVQEVMQLQAELVKTQLQAIAEQTTELADAAIKTSMGVTKP